MCGREEYELAGAEQMATTTTTRTWRNVVLESSAFANGRTKKREGERITEGGEKKEKPSERAGGVDELC